ncbi:efflux RND transporter periplasmic adaptor subunit [Mangrovibrevibacter kandeliae]|uniref:efflux RND transporter periplasmic adaptor subunit n=1 Tax=Mangrovibrevibacter kandeliae TaxID=2968473 RepID=UPI00211769FA|nr:efflux RND transporter periplasmic adaptor subunit [Aurantimonas sp. CSK15Z-1]
MVQLRVRPKTATMLAGLLAALAACSEEATPERPLQAVEVTEVQPAPYSHTVALTGEIAARFEASLSFKTGGRVDRVEVDVGSHVEPGTLLASLDPAEQQADVTSAEAAVRSADAQLRQAKAAFERQRSLLGGGYTTRSSFESADEGVKTAQGALDAAKAALEQARTALTETDLTADTAGIITQRSVDAGQVVAAAQTVFGFAKDGPRDAVFDVQEQLVTAAGPPPQIEIALLSDPNVRTTGHVREVSPLLDPQRGTVEVKVGLDTVPPQMALGAAVVGRETTPPIEAILLPWQALVAKEGRPAVWKLDPANDTVTLQPIEVARYDFDKIVVAAGLANGDRIVVAPAQLLRPGQPVSVAKTEAER